MTVKLVRVFAFQILK